MAARWRALELAPALVEKAKALWEKVAKRAARPNAPAPLAPEVPVEIRFPALEGRVAGLEEEAASSFEVVSSIAQQHSQLTEQNSELVRVVDVLLARTRALAWACGILAAAFAALLAFILLR